MTHFDPSPKFEVALNAGSILPDEFLNHILGFGRILPGAVVFVRPGDRAPEGPHLRLHPSRTPGAPGTWHIEDRPSYIETEMLGRGKRPFTRSTRCQEGDEERAATRLVLYSEVKRNALLGMLLPTQVSLAAILHWYMHHLESDAHSLRPTTVRSYMSALPALGEFWGGLRLGGVNADKVSEFLLWRTGQDAAPAGVAPRKPRKISPKTAATELVVVKRAINLFGDVHGINLKTKIHVPETPLPPVTWLDRDEMAIYLWVLKGRVYNAEARRWRIMRDDDPSLTGPEGDRRVLRDPETRAHRRRLARAFLLGVYTGGRHHSLLQATYLNAHGASVDWVRGALARKPAHEKETLKRRPGVLLVPKLARNIRNWARNDRAKKIAHLIHRQDGQPYTRHIASKYWYEIDRDAGIGKHVTMHVFRHTCAMWLKGENVSIWAAANFIGCSVKVLETRYGTWDFHSQVEAVQALTRMGRHRAAARELRALGL